DLNRPLPDYPQVPDPAVADPASADRAFISGPTRVLQFQVAQAARQQLAKDIYDTLRAVTGASDPTIIGAGRMGYNEEQFNALRWLAQLAVNIVDYIDNDDYMTPFNWYQEPGGTFHWVFGTELPRLVVNEVYAQLIDP